MANVTQTSFTAAVKTMYERRLLIRAVPRLVHGRPGVQAKINKFGSLEWRRYNSLGTVTTAVTEGTTPAEQAAPSISQLTATPKFYGAWIGYTDQIDYTAYDPFVSEVSGILGEQAGVSMDTIIRNVITDGATKSYMNGEAGRSSLQTPIDDITYLQFIREVAYLEAQNALPCEGDNFCVIMHPYTLATLMSDPTWVNLFIEEAEKGDTPIRNAMVGRLFRCNVYVSSNARKYTAAGVGSVDTFSLLFIGEQAFGVTGIASITPQFLDSGPGYSNLTGQPQKAKPVELIVKDLGSAGADDPLNMRGTIAWKAALDTTVLNNAFMVDAEHTNTFSGGL